MKYCLQQMFNLQLLLIFEGTFVKTKKCKICAIYKYSYTVSFRQTSVSKNCISIDFVLRPTLV